MKKIIFYGFLLSGLCANAQSLFSPLGSIGTSNDANKVLIGEFISPGSYGGQLFINTKVNTSNSTINNLELNYTFSSLSGGGPGGGYTPPNLSVIKARQWDPGQVPTPAWVTVFDLKADGNLFLGTSQGSVV